MRGLAIALGIAAFALLMAACASDHAPACGTRVQRFWRPSQTPLVSDWLFVIDDGPSMAAEQRMLEAQWPAVAERLMRGPTREGEVVGPIMDLHVGVVSVDMGAGGEGFLPGCTAHGDDGLLLAPNDCSLQPSPYEWRYPGFRADDASQRAITCALQLGASGCAVSQPLEALTKALLPAIPLEVSAGLIQPPAPSAMEFLDGTPGHGMGANQGFLRGEELWIVLVTDQDDCSTRDAALFTPLDQLASDDPLRNVEPEQRCFGADYKLRAVREYVTTFSQLRPEPWRQMHFLVVAGFPPDLLDENARRAFQSSDVRDRFARDEAYRRIRNDPRMQVQLREGAAPGEPQLTPSCESASATAYPPRRLLDFAYGLRSQATLASICDLDLAKLVEEALYPEVTEGKRILKQCRIRKRARDEEGRVDCRGTLEILPEPDPAQPLAPSRCSDRPDLLQDPAPGFPTRTPDGNPLCEVRQAPVIRAADGSVMVDGPGWYYYDDEAEELGFDRCAPERGGYELTEGVLPPGLIAFRLECVEESEKVECADSREE